MKTWTAIRLGTNKDGNISYEISCPPVEEKALRKMMEVFFNLEGEGNQ